MIEVAIISSCELRDMLRNGEHEYTTENGIPDYAGIIDVYMYDGDIYIRYDNWENE